MGYLLLWVLVIIRRPGGQNKNGCLPGSGICSRSKSTKSLQKPDQQDLIIQRGNKINNAIMCRASGPPARETQVRSACQSAVL